MYTGAKKTKKAKRIRLLIALGIGALVLLSALFVPQAQALGQNELVLTAKQAVVGNAPSAHKELRFEYLLTAEAAGNPMPAGSDAQGYRFDITGSDEVQIAPISFERPGQYLYKLRGFPEPTDLSGFSAQVFTIEVLVLSDMSTFAVIHRTDNMKVEEMVFEYGFSTSLGNLPPVVEQPESPQGPKNPNGFFPKTGDMVKPLLWLVLLATSGSFLLFTFFRNQRRKNEGNRSDANTCPQQIHPRGRV
ncbi:MAG: hypothetical protein FWE65_00645 [Eggerthellaceae bacterium]|nr:hypothetical protein [Eggerthellaceae bacterium]